MQQQNESRLELVQTAPSGSEKPFDILFVHGISAGAWMWEDGALEHFAVQGFRSWGLSFSNHGFSIGGKRLSQLTLQDYADDLAEALDEIRRPSIIIAHSLGGAVAQKLLASGRNIAGLVLLCSVPPYGLLRASAQMAFTAPRLWREMATYCMHGLEAADIEIIRAGLFPSGVDDTVFKRFAAQLQDESLLAMMEASLGWPPFAIPSCYGNRILVIGGAEDVFVPISDTNMTAWWYGTQPRIIPEAGHMLMYEPAGKTAARTIVEWIADLKRSP